MSRNAFNDLDREYNANQEKVEIAAEESRAAGRIAMKIETTQITKHLITGGDNLDPVSVILEDLGPARGKVIIECFGESWSASWGGMGDRTVRDFMCACDEHYLAGELSRVDPSIEDLDGLANYARRQVIDERRSGEIKKEEARRRFDLCEDLESVEDLRDVPDEMSEIFGPEWWHAVPYKPNPDYQYLCRIILCVQDALRSVIATGYQAKQCGGI